MEKLPLAYGPLREIYKRLKKKVVDPIPRCRKVISKAELVTFIAGEGIAVCALAHKAENLESIEVSYLSEQLGSDVGLLNCLVQQLIHMCVIVRTELPEKRLNLISVSTNRRAETNQLLVSKLPLGFPDQLNSQ